MLDGHGVRRFGREHDRQIGAVGPSAQPFDRFDAAPRVLTAQDEKVGYALLDDRDRGFLRRNAADGESGRSDRVAQTVAGFGVVVDEKDHRRFGRCLGLGRFGRRFESGRAQRFDGADERPVEGGQRDLQVLIMILRVDLEPIRDIRETTRSDLRRGASQCTGRAEHGPAVVVLDRGNDRLDELERAVQERLNVIGMLRTTQRRLQNGAGRKVWVRIDRDRRRGQVCRARSLREHQVLGRLDPAEETIGDTTRKMSAEVTTRRPYAGGLVDSERYLTTSARWYGYRPSGRSSSPKNPPPRISWLRISRVSGGWRTRPVRVRDM